MFFFCFPGVTTHRFFYLGILLNVIPAVYSKLISRKGTVYNTTNVSNSSYVLDQKGNCMFRPLEANFRLHKIDLEDKENNIRVYSKRNGVSMLRSQHYNVLG